MTNSTWIDIPAKDIRKWISELLDSGKFKLLSTLTGYQDGSNICILYHFHTSDGAVNVRVTLPLADPKMISVTPILPGAVLYEREIQDLLGVVFEDLSDPRRFVLPEQWPQGVYPLRKDFKTPKEEQYK